MTTLEKLQLQADRMTSARLWLDHNETLEVWPDKTHKYMYFHIQFNTVASISEDEARELIKTWMTSTTAPYPRGMYGVVK